MVGCKIFFGRSVRSKWRVAYLKLKVCDCPYGSEFVLNGSEFVLNGSNLRPEVFPAVLAFAGDKTEAIFDL